MSNETDSFIQEVDERVREDRVMTFFKRWGLWLGGALVVVLVGIGGWQLWRAQQTESARSQAEAYVAAQELARAGNLDDAKAAFENLTNEGPRTYRVMAQLEHAAVLEAQGDLQGALAEFDAAAEAATDPLMKRTAQMRAAYLVAETQDFAAVQARLTPIIEGGGQLATLAQELLAVEAWEAGEVDLARQTLDAIALAFEAPESVRQRAQVALAVIGPAPATAEQETTAPAPAAPAQ
ncbi:Mlr7403 protein [alpha proteobacterium U9-1i]|nr:Mlr7403 protein [alpha proteobacterium U9-1i]